MSNPQSMFMLPLMFTRIKQPTRLPDIPMTDSLWKSFDECYMHFLLGMMLEANPQKHEGTFPKRIWFAEQVWFLREIGDLLRNLYPNKTQEEIMVIIDQLIKEHTKDPGQKDS